MTTRLRDVKAGRPREAPQPRAGHARAGIGPQHLPRRVPENRVEAAIRSRTALHVEEHFRELQRPVKRTGRARLGRDAIELRRHSLPRERRGTTEGVIDEHRVSAAWRRVSHGKGAPDVAGGSPLHEGRMTLE
jgi:hypothetical protein